MPYILLTHPLSLIPYRYVMRDADILRMLVGIRGRVLLSLRR